MLLVQQNTWVQVHHLNSVIDLLKDTCNKVKLIKSILYEWHQTFPVIEIGIFIDIFNNSFYYM
jgi:hypothetical protein